MGFLMANQTKTATETFEIYYEFQDGKRCKAKDFNWKKINTEQKDCIFDNIYVPIQSVLMRNFEQQNSFDSDD